MRTTHKFKSLGFVCSPSFFSLPTTYRLSRVGRFSLALLSLRKYGGLLVVYSATSPFNFLLCYVKHLEVRQKYSAARSILNSLLGVSSGDEDCVSCLIYYIKLTPQSVKKTLICMWFRSPFRRKARFIHTFLSFLPRPAS